MELTLQVAKVNQFKATILEMHCITKTISWIQEIFAEARTMVDDVKTSNFDIVGISSRDIYLDISV